MRKEKTFRFFCNMASVELGYCYVKDDGLKVGLFMMISRGMFDVFSLSVRAYQNGAELVVLESDRAFDDKADLRSQLGRLNMEGDSRKFETFCWKTAFALAKKVRDGEIRTSLEAEDEIQVPLS